MKKPLNHFLSHFKVVFLFSRILNRSLSTKNEPILNFELNSKERLDVEEALKEVETHTRCIPIVIGGEEHFPNDIRYQCSVSVVYFKSTFIKSIKNRFLKFCEDNILLIIFMIKHLV